jgi:hypothetical protein
MRMTVALCRYTLGSTPPVFSQEGSWVDRYRTGNSAGNRLRSLRRRSQKYSVDRAWREKSLDRFKPLVHAAQ